MHLVETTDGEIKRARCTLAEFGKLDQIGRVQGFLVNPAMTR